MGTSPDSSPAKINPALLLPNRDLVPPPTGTTQGFSRLGEVPVSKGFSTLGQGNTGERATPPAGRKAPESPQGGTLFKSNAATEGAMDRSIAPARNDRRGGSSAHAAAAESASRGRVKIPRQPGCIQIVPEDYFPMTIFNAFFHFKEVIASNKKYGQDPFEGSPGPTP